MNEKILQKVNNIGMVLRAAKSVTPKFLNRQSAELGALAKQLE